MERTDKVKRTNGTGGIINVEGTKNLYIIYRVNRRQVRESCKSPVREVAERLLQKRLGEHGLGLRPAQDAKNVRYEAIRDAYVEDFRNRGKTMIKRADGTEYVRGVPQLDEFFQGVRAVSITVDEIRRYIKSRQSGGVSGPSIKRELVTLRAIMNQAVEDKKLGLADIPRFPMPEDSAPIGVYVTPEEFKIVSLALPENLRPFFTFMYSTGCRLGAAMKLRWSMISADRTEIKIPGELIKSRQPLTLVLAGPILEPLAQALRRMFPTDGPVFDFTNYRQEWSKACVKAGIGTHDKITRIRTGARIHDCRCSAAVNLIDAGVSEDVVMKIGGWKTKEMFSRYNVMNTSRVRQAMEQSGAYVVARMNGTK